MQNNFVVVNYAILTLLQYRNKDKGMLINKSVFLSALLLGLTAFALSANAASLIYEGNPHRSNLFFKDMVKPNGLKLRPSRLNPIIKGDNVYAPDLLRVSNKWFIYYGGWKTPGVNDEIYLGITDDMAIEGPVLGNHTVIKRGAYAHVNDPSVQRVNFSRWVMAYTIAEYSGNNERAWINISTSHDGTQWYPSTANRTTEIKIDGARLLGAGKRITYAARPSLLWDNGQWKLWFDGKINNGEHASFLAVSNESTPINFTAIKKYPSIGGFPGFYEPDVEKTSNGYVAVVQRHFNGLYKYVSSNGVDFRLVGRMISNSEAGAKRIDNPGFIYDSTNKSTYGVAFGMTDNTDLVEHDVGFAYSQYKALAESCPNVWHQYQEAVFYETVKLKTYRYSAFCRIRIIDPDTRQILLNKAVRSAAGDQWRFVR
jgi:hypothetical protein